MTSSAARYFMVALLADMITANRKILERLVVRVRRLEYHLMPHEHRVLRSTERMHTPSTLDGSPQGD